MKKRKSTSLLFAAEVHAYANNRAPRSHTQTTTLPHTLPTQAARPGWEDFKKKQKEIAVKEDADAAAARDYRLQLDADRALRMGQLAGGGGGGREGGKKDKKDKKDKKKKSKKDKKDKKERGSSRKHSSKDKKKKKKRRRHSSSSGSSSSSSSGSDSDSDRGGGGGGGAAKRAKKADSPIKLSEYLRS